MIAPNVPPENPASSTNEDARAKRYDAIHLRLFVLRALCMFAALAAYAWIGASDNLAEALASRFEPHVWPTFIGYFAVTIFGYWALFYPLDQYQGFTLEHQFGMSHQTYGAWCRDHLKSLVLEVLIGATFLSVLYAIIHHSPNAWWVWSTVVYGVFAVLMATVLPIWILPLFYELEPLDDERTESITEFMREKGVAVTGVYRWGLEDKTAAANAALTGLGKTRRIILGDTLLDDYSDDEILAILAHEVGHHKHRDMVRMLVLSVGLAGAGFLATHLILTTLQTARPAATPFELGAFPLLAAVLYAYMLLAMPIANLVSRTREFAADAFAVRAMRSASPLVSALEKLATQNLTHKNPSAWVEFLLHSHPSVQRRVRHAHLIEQEQVS